MSEKQQFASKIGLIAATVGSAIGLGNVWRFPAETQTNGGAAFLILYIVCVLVLGVPVMLAEFSLGRGGRSDAIGVFRKLAPGSLWWIVGALGVLSAYVILMYYMVVTGWTLEYLVQSVDGALYSGIGTAGTEGLAGLFTERMNDYVGSTWSPLIFTWIVIGLNIVILMGGVQKGIERLSNVLMPVLFVILLLMLVVSLTLPDAGAGVAYFLDPDFSKIDARTVISALGQALFSLSIGMGVLVTYSSYYPASTRLGRTSVIVALTSVLVAVLMGLIIFPAVTSFGLDGESMRGATLIFVTLPEVFARLPLPWLWSALFFALLLVAAITSTVSICEVPVAALQDRCGYSRRRAVLTVLLPLTALSALCSLSFGPLADVKILGYTIFDFLDMVSTNLLLPAVALGICLYMGWFAPKGLLADELSNNGSLRGSATPAVTFLIRYLAPLAIALIVVFNYI
ncbi:MAG: sodium-dependent transporter [Muribaculaceae bacterium]|nr:sodium-dependent transporter [Muribaculaceae bacterium]